MSPYNGAINLPDSGPLRAAGACEPVTFRNHTTGICNMAHDIIGIKDREAAHHAHLLASHEHHHDHGASGHFHEHARGDAQQAARSATFWLFITLLGGVFLITSYIVQFYSPYENGKYLYDYHIDLAATIGAVLLAVRVIWQDRKSVV